MKQSKKRGIFPKKTVFLKGDKGFTLIGVLVASAIGLIVVAGLTQLFINMGAQIKQVENRAGLRTFKTLIEKSLQDRDGCKNTLDGFCQIYAFVGQSEY